MNLHLSLYNLNDWKCSSNHTMYVTLSHVSLTTIWALYLINVTFFMIVDIITVMFQQIPYSILSFKQYFQIGVFKNHCLLIYVKFTHFPGVLLILISVYVFSWFLIFSVKMSKVSWLLYKTFLMILCKSQMMILTGKKICSCKTWNINYSCVWIAILVITQRVAVTLFLKYNQQDAMLSRSIYFYKLLYMFQAVPPPIIRHTKLYIQRQVLSNQYCCLLLSWMRWN